MEGATWRTYAYLVGDWRLLCKWRYEKKVLTRFMWLMTGTGGRVLQMVQ